MILCASTVYAGGPKYNYDESRLNDEMNNIYKGQSFPNWVNAKGSSATLTYLNVTSGTAGNFTILNGSFTTFTGSNATITNLNTSNINGTFIGLGRNRILNGDMRIDQVREGTAYSTASGGSLAGGGQAFYALDQWRFEATVSSTFTVLQTGESLPPTTLNSLFNKAMRISIISSGTINASDAANMEYPMDPVYEQDFGWGSSAAVPVTLQFWVVSSSAGIHSIAFLNGVNSRSYVTTYTIAAQNTWQREIITIPGDTAGAPAVWPTSGTVFGLKIVWDMGSGSGVTTSTLGQWQNGSVWRASGSDDFVKSLASVYFTGVQLEIGSTATSFEYMPYDMELRSLQRYYWKSFPSGTVVGTGKGYPGAISYISQVAGATAYGVQVVFPTPMLTTPVITTYNPTSANAKWYNQSIPADSGASTIFNTGSTGFLLYNIGLGPEGAGQLINIHATANARLGGS